jgi:hypothetical protein
MNLSWLKTVAHFAPIILALTPLAPIAGTSGHGDSGSGSDPGAQPAPTSSRTS